MTKNSRALLKELHGFTKHYFLRRTPIIKWKKADYVGEADIRKNVIYLNPNISTDIIGCKVGTGIFYHPKTKLKLKDGEQYFFVLLHEIGHFKIKIKPPIEWIKLKRKLYREANAFLKTEKEKDGRFGLRRRTKKEERQFICDYLADQAALEMKRGEKEIDYLGRNEDFRNWLFRGSVSEHMKVENWAISQFKKRRLGIRKILAKLDLC